MSLNLRAIEKIRRLLRPIWWRIDPRHRPYYRDPRSYWERRHQRAGATLEGVGLLGLGSSGNARDYDEKWERIAGVLERLGSVDGKTLLDAGCGIGRFSAGAAAMGFRVEGVDFSSGAIDTARATVGSDVRWHVSELHSFQPQRRYDVVMCIDVLFHIVDEETWAATVQRLASLVERGGYLLIQEELRERSTSVTDPSRIHVRRRTEGDYLAALGGWQMLERDTYGLPAQGTKKDLMLFERGAVPW